jgi:RNA-directed DNA polymerase
MKDDQALSNELGFPLHFLRSVASDPKPFYLYRRRQLGKKKRVLRIPKGPLVAILRAIKTRLLDPMPLAATVHGWRKRRSPKTYAKNHVRQAVVVNADIQDFFPSVGAGRVYGFWTEAGYSPEAAKLLTSLTTLDNQLPQGSPTSQSVGNQVLRGLNRRLSALARQHGLNYGSYGDEVSISGRRRARRLKGLTLRIIQQEGFKANPDKVKVMSREGRQELTGNVVNKKIGPGRPKYRELRATLHNCLQCGPESQNRAKHPNFKQHLRGRIAQFQYLNPRLGEDLLAEFDKIQWSETRGIS